MQIARLPKRELIRRHFIGKVSRGLRSPDEFTRQKFVSELAGIRSHGNNGANPAITLDDVRNFFSEAGINQRNVSAADIEKAKALKRGGAKNRGSNPASKYNRVRPYVGAAKEMMKAAAVDYSRRKREKALYALGVFKPRIIRNSAFVICRRSGNKAVRPPDVKRAVRILNILNETESKAMKISDLQAKLKGSPLFPPKGSMKRPILNLRSLGIVDTSIHGWVIVSAKFATVDENLLRLKMDWLKARDRLDHINKIILSKHGGMCPPATHPDGKEAIFAEGAVNQIERKISKTSWLLWKTGKASLKKI